MNIKVSGYMTIILFIALAAVGFFLWVGVILIAWVILRSVGINADFWVMLEALSLAVAAATVLSGGFVAYRELSEAASSRHMEVADRLFGELNSPDNISARRWVFQNLGNDPGAEVQDMTEEGRAAIKQVLNSLDHVAFLTQAGWIPDEIIMPWMQPMIAKCWEKLAPYVNYEKQRRHETYYYRYVSELARRCQDWQVKYSPDWKVTWLDDAL
jgi:hypothetical protein